MALGMRLSLYAYVVCQNCTETQVRGRERGREREGERERERERATAMIVYICSYCQYLKHSTLKAFQGLYMYSRP